MMAPAASTGAWRAANREHIPRPLRVHYVAALIIARRASDTMAFYEKWFGKGRLAARARAAELRGDLAKAAVLFGEAGQADEAARVVLVRAEGESDPALRLQLLTQAARLAPDGTKTSTSARLKRAELVLALAGDAAVSAVARHEVLDAARELEAIGEHLTAADAYARAGDKEGEARALQAAGDIERLELLLVTEQHEERTARARVERAKDIDLMIGCGKRREALEALDELLADAPADATLEERAARLRARRVTGPIVRIDATRDPALGPERYALVMGREVVVGRTEGTIRVPSAAVSREHLRITREEGGELLVHDLGSRNGTQLRGINVRGAIPIGDGLELTLGREVPLRVAPSSRLDGAVSIEVAGERYHASLDVAARTPVPELVLEAGPDGWVELVPRGAHAYAGEVELVPRATLLAGDSISTERGRPPVLTIAPVK